MAHKIKCTRCHSPKIRRIDGLPKNGKLYVCRNCKYRQFVQRHFDELIYYSIPYRKLRKDLIEQVKLFETSNNPIIERQQTFIKNIQTIMSANYIRDYKFEVLDNKLQYIRLYNLPFITEIKIPIYGNKKEAKIKKD